MGEDVWKTVRRLRDVGLACSTLRLDRTRPPVARPCKLGPLLLEPTDLKHTWPSLFDRNRSASAVPSPPLKSQANTPSLTYPGREQTSKLGRTITVPAVEVAGRPNPPHLPGRGSASKSIQERKPTTDANYPQLPGRSTRARLYQYHQRASAQ